VDVTAREATDVSDEDSEVLALDTLLDILMDGRKVLDCPQHPLRLMKSSDKTGVDLRDDESTRLAHIIWHVPDFPNRQPPMPPVSLGANSYGMGTHRPSPHGVQRALLLGREHAQVIVCTTIVVNVVTEYVRQAGSGFFRQPRELFHLK
jgi:hypothetical protein